MLGDSWGSLAGPLGSFGVPLGMPWESLGFPWGPLGVPWGSMGGPWIKTVLWLQRGALFSKNQLPAAVPARRRPVDAPADASGTRIVHNQHLLKSTEIYKINLPGPALGSRVYLPCS